MKVHGANTIFGNAEHHAHEKYTTYMIFETSVRVRYAETDAMGVVHHSRYFVWLELARVEWLKACGLDYKKLEQDGFFLPVVEADLKYHSPTFFDDEIRIKLTPPQDIHRVRFALTYELFRGEIRVADGKTVHVFLNKERKLIKPPMFFIEVVLKQLNTTASLRPCGV